MAHSTEEDLIEDVKVVVIKLPFDLQERLLTFPFLHLISEHYPKAELHFITPKKQIEVLNLLPFTAYYHEFDEDEIRTIFDVHRYTVTAKLYNVDLFISLTNSFVDACLGLGLRAKQRLGFSDGWKTMIFTMKTPRPQGHHVVEDYLALYRALIGKNVDIKPRAISRDLSAIIPEWETQPYVAINLCPIRHAGVEEEIVDLINLFENQRIILFASEDQEKLHHLMEPFLTRLSKKNSYTYFTHKSWIELAKMLSFSRGMISFNGAVANLAAYIGARSVILYDSENPQRVGPLYFLAETMILDVNDPSLSLANPAVGLIKNRRKFDMSEVFGHAFSFFRLSGKASSSQ